MPCLIHCQLPVTVCARVLIFSTTTNWPIVEVMHLQNLVVKKSAISFCTLEYQDWLKEMPSMVLVELGELVIFLPQQISIFLVVLFNERVYLQSFKIQTLIMCPTNPTHHWPLPLIIMFQFHLYPLLNYILFASPWMTILRTLVSH